MSSSFDPGARDPSPWWRAALSAFAARARLQLRRRFPSIHEHHDDVLGDTVLSLTSTLCDPEKAASLPASWFAPHAPAPADAERFENLAFTVLNRRVMDVFRLPHRRFVESLSDIAEHQEPPQEGDGAEVTLDRARTVRVLLSLIARLPAQDRELLEAVALGGHEYPMSARDRQRLRRLRIELIDRLRSRLGAAVLETIARL